MADPIKPWFRKFRPWQEQVVLAQRHPVKFKHFVIRTNPYLPEVWHPEPADPLAAFEALSSFVERNRKISGDPLYITTIEQVTDEVVQNMTESPIMFLNVHSKFFDRQERPTAAWIQIALPDKMIFVAVAIFRAFVARLPAFVKSDTIVLLDCTTHAVQCLKLLGVFLFGVVDVSTLRSLAKAGGEAEYKLDLDVMMNNAKRISELHKSRLVDTSEDEDVANFRTAAEISFWRWHTTVQSLGPDRYREVCQMAMEYMAPLVASEIHLPKQPEDAHKTFEDEELDLINRDVFVPHLLTAPVIERARALWRLRSLIAAQLAIPVDQVLDIIEIFNHARSGLLGLRSAASISEAYHYDMRPVPQLAATVIAKVACQGHEAMRDLRKYQCTLCGQKGHFEAICSVRLELGYDFDSDEDRCSQDVVDFRSDIPRGSPPVDLKKMTPVEVEAAVAAHAVAPPLSTTTKTHDVPPSGSSSSSASASSARSRAGSYAPSPATPSLKRSRPSPSSFRGQSPSNVAGDSASKGSRSSPITLGDPSPDTFVGQKPSKSRRDSIISSGGQSPSGLLGSPPSNSPEPCSSSSSGQFFMSATRPRASKPLKTSCRPLDGQVSSTTARTATSKKTAQSGAKVLTTSDRSRALKVSRTSSKSSANKPRSSFLNTAGSKSAEGAGIAIAGSILRGDASGLTSRAKPAGRPVAASRPLGLAPVFKSTAFSGAAPEHKSTVSAITSAPLSATKIFGLSSGKKRRVVK